MANQTETDQLLANYLPAKGPLREDLILSVCRQVTDQVALLHASGQIHRSISTETIVINGQFRATLGPPQDEDVDCSTHAARGAGPPEIEQADPMFLPARIDSAQAILSQANVDCDPRRVDVYQIGGLALELLIGESPATYLMSAKAKAEVPAAWLRMIDGALGHDPAIRIDSCEQLREAQEKIAVADSTQSASDTPPAGTGSDVHRGTPAFGRHAVTDSADDSSLPFRELGHYRIDSLLGSGGMGDVYRGYDPRLDRTVAIKVLPLELARDGDFVTRFTSEARAAAKLDHSHIVPIYFIGEDQGYHFFAMRYVPGESLAHLMKRDHGLPVERALEIVEQIVAGLAEAHGHGLIHRDIKPGNILLDSQTGKALLADFGLVKSLSSNVQATATGVVMGTVDYISPEQGRGHAVDGRSDLYSVGVLIYHMLSGQLPFTADSPTAMIFQHAYETPPSLTEIMPRLPTEVAAIVDCLLLKDPAARYQSAASLLGDIQRVRRGEEPLLAKVQVETAAETSIIYLPDEDLQDEPIGQPAETQISIAPQGWRNRLLALLQLHAPVAIKNLQNTQQQVDGGLAVYEGRRNRLARLATEARSVERALADQVAVQQAAASEAEQRAGQAASPADADEAYQQQQDCEENAVFLAARLAEQQEQSDQIRRQLAKVDVTLAKLRSQRQLLLARLKTAEAGAKVAAGPSRQRHEWRKATLLGLMLIGTTISLFGLGYFSRQAQDATNGSTLSAGISSDPPQHVRPSSPTDGISFVPQALRSHLVLYYPFDHQQVRVEDRSGNGNHGANHGVTLTDLGIVNGAYVFNGVNSYIECLDHPSLDLVDGMTVAFWAKFGPPVEDYGAQILYKASPKPAKDAMIAWYYHGHHPESTVGMSNACATIGGNWEGVKGFTPTENRWYHLAATYNGVEFVSYEDGVPCGSRSESGGLATNDRPLLIGRGYGPRHGLHFPGVIDELMIFNHALSGDQINSLRDSQDEHHRSTRTDGQDDLTAIAPEVKTPEVSAPKKTEVPKAAPTTNQTSLEYQPTEQSATDSPIVSGYSDQWEWSAPINAGPVINSEHSESKVMLARGDRTLIVSSDRPGGQGHWDLWVVQRDESDAPWKKAENLGPGVNSEGYEAEGTITDDGLILLFCSDRSGGLGKMDLYMSTRDSTASPWGKAVNLGPNINTQGEEWGPSLTTDGLTVTFSSLRPGGVGSVDLWESTRSSRLEPWGPPVNLGIWINSPQHDWLARYSTDRLALVFHSNRPGGLGSDDLWLCTRSSQNLPFGLPVNLGANINSHHYEISGVLSADGTTLWFGSDRPGGIGGADIWYSRRVPKSASRLYRSHKLTHLCSVKLSQCIGLVTITGGWLIRIIDSSYLLNRRWRGLRELLG